MPTKKENRAFRHFRHACKMVGRNAKAYMKLSVTVVLSFTILLGYMAMTDASLHNQYAKVFSLPRQIVQCYTYDAAVADTFLSQVEKNIPDASCYRYISAATPLTAYEGEINAECFFVPEGVQMVYAADSTSTVDSNSPGLRACVEPVKLLGEKQDFYLEQNQAIINETFYNSLLSGGAKEPIRIPLTFYWGDGSCSVWNLQVVGVCEDSVGQFIQYNQEREAPEGYVTIYLSQSLLIDGGEMGEARHIAFVSSESPEQVMSFGRALGMVAQGIVEAQNEAKIAVRSAISSKAVTAAVMLALLAMSLYSSLSNVLETRNFEIGVKRAIGASKWAIVRQFLYEALLVLGFDMILSVALVADGMIVYKLVKKCVYGITWVAYISPYSCGIYAVSTLGLVLTFSLIFAYRSTRVEIVQYLKAE